MKHAIISRCNFSDKILLDHYLNICKEILIPQLKLQTNTNFEWILLSGENFKEYILNTIDFPIKILTKQKCLIYLRENKFNIQTRHDIDDYMSIDYIEKIQDTCKDFKKDCLISFIPTLFDYSEKQQYLYEAYSEKAPSMFLSLYQKNLKYFIYEDEHTKMSKIINNVITIKGQYVKWVIHGKNLTCKRNPEKIKNRKLSIYNE